MLTTDSHRGTRSRQSTEQTCSHVGQTLTDEFLVGVVLGPGETVTPAADVSGGIDTAEHAGGSQPPSAGLATRSLGSRGSETPRRIRGSCAALLAENRVRDTSVPRSSASGCGGRAASRRIARVNHGASKVHPASASSHELRSLDQRRSNGWPRVQPSPPPLGVGLPRPGPG